jgi:hypothetical protein
VVREALGEDGYATATARGAAIPLAEVIAVALTTPEAPAGTGTRVREA